MSVIRASALLLAIVTALIYAPTLGFEFVVYDDDVYVVDNAQVRSGLTPAGIRWAVTSGRASNWHPLTWVSHMLDVELYGENPRGHHATNVGLHVLNALLLCGLLVSATRRPGLSLVVAALFALHPINVETVAWVAQRKSLLSTALGLGASWAYVAYTRRGGPSRYLLSATLLALGLMAKPMLVTLPILFLLLDYWPLERVQFRAAEALEAGRSGPQRRSPSRLVMEKVPLLALVAASSVVTFLVQRGGGAVGTTDALGVAPRLATAVVAYARYLRKTVWPHDLAIIYQHPYLEGGSPLEPWRIALATVLIAAITVAAVRLYRRRWLAVGWIWYLVALVPVIGLVQVGNQGMADRYAYVPLIGIFVLLVWGADSLLSENVRGPGFRRGLKAGLVLAVLGLASAGTWRQQQYWRDSEALFARGLEVSPLSPTLHYNLGTVLEAQGRPDEAVRQYRRSLAAGAGSAPAHFGLANALHASGDAEAAVREYETTLGLDAEQAEAWFNLGNTLRSLGRGQEAVRAYRRALEIEPGYAAAHNNLGTALLASGSLGQALRQFERGVEADPTLADLQHNLGVALVRAGRWEEALPRFRVAASLAPTWTAPLISASWILAAGPSSSLRDPTEAIVLARRATELGDNPGPEALDALGLALASAGRFDEAAQAAENALDLASREGRDTLARDIRNRVLSYRRKIPPVPGE
jgi:tetratricopeptide (TPR) repeat protein